MSEISGIRPDIRWVPDTGYFRHMIDMIEENSMKISHLFIKTRASKSIKSEQNVFIKFEDKIFDICTYKLSCRGALLYRGFRITIHI